MKPKQYVSVSGIESLAQYPGLSCDAEGKLGDYPEDQSAERLRYSNFCPVKATGLILDAYKSV